MKKKQPDVIISTTVGTFSRYVFNAPFGPDNIRRPSLTDDPEKARRFWTEQGAADFISRFKPDGKKYQTEIFKPATTLA